MQSTCHSPIDPISPESEKVFSGLYEEYKLWHGSNKEIALPNSALLDQLTNLFLEHNICLIKGKFCGFFKVSYISFFFKKNVAQAIPSL